MLSTILYNSGLHKHSFTSAGGTTGVFVHQLSKRRSQVRWCASVSVFINDFFQNPFHSLKGQVQKVVFHPSRPFFFVAVSIEQLQSLISK